MIAILDNIRSVHNVGSIFRTADGAGIERVILCGVTPKPVDRFQRIRSDFAKTALGAEKNVAWEYEENAIDAIRKLKGSGWHIIALEQTKESKDIFGMKVIDGEKTALVVGSEVEGISADILKKADEIAEIPMRGAKESLNVSVAFGIAAYALTRQVKVYKMKSV